MKSAWIVSWRQSCVFHHFLGSWTVILLRGRGEWVAVLRLAGYHYRGLFEQTHFVLGRHGIQLGTEETDLHELPWFTLTNPP